MFSFFSKVFTSVAVAVSALFGGHAKTVPPTPVVEQPISTSTQSAVTVPSVQEVVKLNTTSSTRPSSIITTIPAKTTVPISTQDSQPVVSNTEPVQQVVVTPSIPAVVTPPAPAAPTVNITDNDASNPYDGFNVNWTATNARSCTLNSSPVLLAPVGSQVTGEIYTPTTYNITCTGEGGSVSNKIVVQPYPTCKPTPESGEPTGGYPTALINGKCVVLN
jgi:hypothetical protein